MSATRETPADIKAGIAEYNHVAESNVSPKLITNSNGSVKKVLVNLGSIIASDELIKGIGYNEFSKETTIKGKPIDDDFINKLRLMVDKQYLITFTKDDVLTVVNQLAKELNSYNPIKKMIESRPWDETQRAETIFIDYLGANDDEYTRTVTRKWLAGAVARVYHEGVKFELVPILQGKQGRGKSTLASKLGGEYFLDTLKSLGKTKDDYQLLQGSWICELGELASLNSTETENTKNFISATSDKIRLPYDRITSEHKRTCVFIGTTNADEYLNDLTGSRRFFPIPLNNDPTKNVFKLDNESIQQIWAESYHYYNQGEEIYSDKNLEKLAKEYREAVSEEDLIFSDIDTFLEMQVPTNWDNLSLWNKRNYYYKFTQDNEEADESEPLTKTTAKEIARVCFKLESDNRRSRSILTKINLYMSNLDGWNKQTIRYGNKTAKGFKRKL